MEHRYASIKSPVPILFSESVFYVTGRQSLGAVIRKLDYIKVKHWHEYDDEDDYPGKKLDEFYRECKADITFDELKVP